MVNVVDDSRTSTIPVSIPQGEAVIVSVDIPSSFTPGVPFDIGATITNIGETDDLFIRFTNNETGRLIAEAIIRLAGGATGDWGVNITLQQTTDFHLLTEAGHVE